MNTLRTTFLLSVLLFLVAGCSQQNEMNESEAMESDEDTRDITELVAILNPTLTNEAYGIVRFFDTEEGVRVVAEIHELAPNSTHGFHIHEFGDCTELDGTSAGGHFNPQDQPHGGPDSEERHVGDLGNITVDENGYGEVDYIDTMLSFEGANNIIGRGVIVHADEDDLESQPTGDAGARLSCGVIGIANQ